MLKINYFCIDNGECPFIEWLHEQNYKVKEKIVSYIKQLGEYGYQLRRPYSENLGKGIYELRPTYQGIHYRVLYFFHGREIAVIACVLVKEKRIPEKELVIAINRKKKYKSNPEKHTYKLLINN